MSAPSLLGCVAAFQDDVAGYYRALRSLPRPVYRDDTLDAWVVTGYAECAGLLGSSALSRQRLRLAPALATTELGAFAIRVFEAQSNFLDSEEGKARRRYWMRALRDGLGDIGSVKCHALARTLLDTRRSTEVDLYGEILQPYASSVVCSRLGVSEQERRGLYPHLVRYARFLDGKTSTLAALEQALVSIVTLYHQLARKWDAFGRGTMGRHEWSSDYIFALAAGHDSVPYALGTIVINGCCGREIHSAAIVRESFRYDSPVQIIGRRAVDAFELGDARILPGDRLLLHIGSANRDPSVFNNPDRFEPVRSEADLAFGWADSRCPGRGVAHDESVAWLESLHELQLAVSVAASPVRGDHGLAGRGISALPVRIHPSSAGSTHA